MDCLKPPESLILEKTTTDQVGDASAPQLPKISLVTATLNQGQFIENTILSVINQNYPNLEHVILDGQSTDNTVEVIRQYERHFSYWLSEPDEGAADAIEKGRQMISGELFNWLNSDDYLLPGTLLSLGTIARKFPDFDIYTFLSMGAGEAGPLYAHFSKWPKMMNFYLSSCRTTYFGQESTFVRPSFMAENNIRVRREYSHIFDTILYEEMLAKGARVLFINAFGGVMRHHPLSKTTLGAPPCDREKAILWEKEMFNWKQRFWRRLNYSRFHKLQIELCNNPVTLSLIKFLVRYPKHKFKICEFIGLHCDREDAWEIRTVN